MRLHTTTWKNRNSDLLERIMDAARHLALPHPVIMDIGPGAGSAFWLRLHPGGKIRQWTWSERVLGGIGRTGDSIWRSLPAGSFSCPEVEEVYLASRHLNPERIEVVDVEFRVLKAALATARLVGNEALFTFHRVDVATQPLPTTADLVIAYQVIERTPDRHAALRTIAAAVRPGGLLSIMTSLEIAGLERVEDTLWHRPSS